MRLFSITVLSLNGFNLVRKYSLGKQKYISIENGNERKVISTTANKQTNNERRKQNE